MGGVFEKCCKSKPLTQAEKDKKAEKDNQMDKLLEALQMKKPKDV